MRGIVALKMVCVAINYYLYIDLVHYAIYLSLAID